MPPSRPAAGRFRRSARRPARCPNRPGGVAAGGLRAGPAAQRGRLRTRRRHRGTGRHTVLAGVRRPFAPGGRAGRPAIRWTGCNRRHRRGASAGRWRRRGGRWRKGFPNQGRNAGRRGCTVRRPRSRPADAGRRSGCRGRAGRRPPRPQLRRKGGGGPAASRGETGVPPAERRMRDEPAGRCSSRPGGWRRRGCSSRRGRKARRPYIRQRERGRAGRCGGGWRARRRWVWNGSGDWRPFGFCGRRRRLRPADGWAGRPAPYACGGAAGDGASLNRFM